MNTRKMFPAAILAIISLMVCGTITNLSAQQKPQQAPSGNSGQNQSMPGMDMDHDMPGMNMGQAAGDKDPQAEHGAMDAMSHMHHHQMGPHMYMTALRPASPQDWAKANTIAQQLREALE